MSDVIYAIGDVHGHLDKLRAVHRYIEEDRARHGLADAPVVHVGDLVDRGPDSAGVIAHLCEGAAGGKPWVMIRGNHDRLMQWFMEDPTRKDPRLRADYDWLHPRMGGRDTLASYGVEIGEDVGEMQAQALVRVPETHREFLRNMERAYETGALFITHAGVRAGVALAAQDTDDLLWIRQEFLTQPHNFGRLIVHGHTPVDAVEHHGYRLNIDTGAAWGKDVSAVVIDGLDVFHVTASGRVRIEPINQSG